MLTAHEFEILRKSDRRAYTLAEIALCDRLAAETAADAIKARLSRKADREEAAIEAAAYWTERGASFRSEMFHDVDAPV